MLKEIRMDCPSCSSVSSIDNVFSAAALVAKNRIRINDAVLFISLKKVVGAHLDDERLIGLLVCVASGNVQDADSIKDIDPTVCNNISHIEIY